MKIVFYLLLLVGLTSCTTYSVSSQSPNQYTPVSEQVIIEDPDVVYIDYTPTLTFTSFYTYRYYQYWNWRRYYFAGYPNYWNTYHNYWGWNYYNWNPYQYNWNYYNPYAWNHYNWNHYNWYHNNWHSHHYNPFFSPVVNSNNKKPNHKYTSTPVNNYKKLDRTPTYYKPQPSRPNYNNGYRKPPQPTRYQPSQPTRQPRSTPRTTTPSRIQQSTPIKRR